MVIAKLKIGQIVMRSGRDCKEAPGYIFSCDDVQFYAALGKIPDAHYRIVIAGRAEGGGWKERSPCTYPRDGKTVQVRRGDHQTPQRP